MARLFQTPVSLDESLSYLAKNNINIRRGDLVKTPGDNFRNNNIAIYDAKQLIDLPSIYEEGTDIPLIDYGVIPPDFFVIDEFPIRYWYDVLPYNNDIVWIDIPKYRNKILRNMNELGSQFVGSDGKVYTIRYDIQDTADEDALTDTMQQFRNALKDNELIPFHLDPIEFEWEPETEEELNTTLWFLPS